MQIAICHYSFHRRWKDEGWTAERLAGEVKALDLPAVDFHAGLLGNPDAAAARIRAALKQNGLTLSGLSLGNDFNMEKPEDFRAQVDTVKRWILVSEEVQAPVSRIFGGHIPVEERNDPSCKAAGRQRIMDALGEVVREAEKHGVVLALENHGVLPCTGEEQMDVLNAINSPALRATIDVGNYLQGGQEGHVGTAIAAPQAAYVHFKDFLKVPDPSQPRGVKLQACVVGDGTVDHGKCLEALRDAGYDGFVAIEYEGTEDEKTGVPRSVEFTRRVMTGF